MAWTFLPMIQQVKTHQERLITMSKAIRLALGLIVKNEAEDLPKCLASFLPEVDFVYILDTGSTDDTIQIARRLLGEYDPFVPHVVEQFLGANDDQGRIMDFSLARNTCTKGIEGLNGTELACDYIVFVDADDILTTPGIKAALMAQPADYYSINYRMNPTFDFLSYKIWKTERKGRFTARVHETLCVDWTKKVVNLDLEFLHHWSVIPGQESSTERNMRILKAEIYPPLRSLFYWANENVDAKNYPEAIKWYLEYIRRAKEGEPCWQIEFHHCYWRAARWLQSLGRSTEAIALCKELLAKDSSWSEAWCELAYIAKVYGDIPLMREYCLAALKNKYTRRLFSEEDKYGTTPAWLLAQEANK